MAFGPGDIVFREGETGDCAYLVEEGTLEVFLESPERRRLRLCGPGEIVGEMAIVGDGRRTACVSALTQCRLLHIGAGRVTRLLESSDPVLRLVVDTIMARVREMIRGRPSPAPEECEHGARRLSVSARAVAQLRMESDLRNGIEAGEIVLYHQPIIDLRKRTIVGFEALARWRHPELGMISPANFIPLAETSGLICSLTRRCLEQGADALARMDMTCDFGPGASPLFVSVNVSCDDLADPTFPDFLRDFVARRPIVAGRMKIEITETGLMSDPVQALASLDTCRALGLGVAIDDFGTGYSSLAYLHKLPIDVLKIDQSFVRALSSESQTGEWNLATGRCEGGTPNDGQSGRIIRTILRLAEEIGVPVVCEGLEFAEDAKALTAMGCAFGQGYHFARPMSIDDACRLIGRGTAELPAT